jgi:hypothetical protein
MQMQLPEFVLLVIATVAAISAGLAMLASKYSVARVLFGIAALSFWSMGVVWSATSTGYNLSTQMIVSAIIGALAAAGFTWVLWEIRTKEAKEARTVTEAEDIEAVCDRTLAVAEGTSEVLFRRLEMSAPFRVGGQYKTQSGDVVTFVGVANEGTSYETMFDQHGVHRYTARDFGRVTGSPHDYSDPRNTPVNQ